MHQQILKDIVDELSPALAGGIFGKIWQLSRASFAIDFHRREAGFLFVTTDPSLPRLHLIRRTTRELEKQSQPSGEFAQSLRATLGGATLKSIKQDVFDRVVRLTFVRLEETGEIHEQVLIAQLTGRSANLFLLDDEGRITHAQRTLTGTGQEVGELYLPPQVHREDLAGEVPFAKGEFESLSVASDNYYRNLESRRSFDTHSGALRNQLRQQAARLEKLRKHLKDDLKAHGDAEEHKRFGDLLLANISSAERRGDKVMVKDFYAAGMPTLEIEVDERTTLQAEAAKYFARYGKAKRAAEQIDKRLADIDSRLIALQQQQTQLAEIVADRDEVALAELTHTLNPEKKTPASPKSKRVAKKIPGVRRYLSADGYEILVGRGAKDNDHLTFRIARAQDLWLHAADYPGSHVIIRNPGRKEIPHRTIIEAAQLAGKFSQAASDAKVNVNYTQQKFVSRIKGAAPGLVRLSSFKTISVEPKEGVERIST